MQTGDRSNVFQRVGWRSTKSRAPRHLWGNERDVRQDRSVTRVAFLPTTVGNVGARHLLLPIGAACTKFQMFLAARTTPDSYNVTYNVLFSVASRASCEVVMIVAGGSLQL